MLRLPYIPISIMHSHLLDTIVDTLPWTCRVQVRETRSMLQWSDANEPAMILGGIQAVACDSTNSRRRMR